MKKDRGRSVEYEMDFRYRTYWTGDFGEADVQRLPTTVVESQRDMCSKDS
jgi:hypothetical protein